MTKQPHFHGLRTVVYPVADLETAKSWYTAALGQEPYFDEPFYVGYNIGGYELGLNPDTDEVQPGNMGGLAYWGVANAQLAYDRLLQMGATPFSEPTNVGGSIFVAAVLDPFGNCFGIIENPHFTLEPLQRYREDI